MAAVASALGVILLTLGSFVEVLDISMAAIASLLVVFGVIELGGKYPYLIYAVTALLAMLLLPIKTPALIYLLFAGYYPIVKSVLERRLPRPVAWAVKFVTFNIGLFLLLFVAVKVFLGAVPEIWWRYWWLLLLLQPIFLLYDIALTRLITAYLTRWRHRLHLSE